MRRVALAVVLLFAGVAAADKKKDEKREPFSSSDDGYRVQFPSDPKTEVKELATAAGVVRMTTRRVEVNRDLVLAVAVAEYPAKFKELAVKTVLDGVRDGLKGTDGRVTLDADVPLDVSGTAVTGRDLRVDAKDNTVRCRTFLVGTKLYQVMATGSKEAVAGPAAEKFLRSFEVIE